MQIALAGPLLVSPGAMPAPLTASKPIILAPQMATYTWANSEPIMFSGAEIHAPALINSALIYHPAYGDTPLMSIALTQPVMITAQDSVTFDIGQINMTGEVLDNFVFPREDYLINEEPEAIDL